MRTAEPWRRRPTAGLPSKTPPCSFAADTAQLAEIFEPVPQPDVALAATALLHGVAAVSYTHLDVYKRQAGTQGVRPCAAVPHGAGAMELGMRVVAFPASAKAA